MRRELIFYDYEFNRLGREGEAASIYIKECYNAIGTAEIHLPLSASCVGLVLNSIYGRGLVVKGDDFCFIATSAQADEDRCEFIIYGRTANWILSRRVCPDFDTAKYPADTPYKTAHTLVKDTWEGVLATGTGADITAEKQAFWRNAYNSLDEVVKDCLDLCKGGHRVIFDTAKKEWRFETFKGQDLPLILSRDTKRANEIKLSVSVLNYFNGGCFQKTASGGESSVQEWQELPSEKTGIYKWTARLSGSDESTAKSELAKKAVENTTELKAAGLVFGTDYALGDTVRVMQSYGTFSQTKRLRITAVERWAEQNDMGERPILEEDKE